jgi:aspartate kinase
MDVYKFGGTSQKDIESLMQCVNILTGSNNYKKHNKIISVHSAPKNITNYLDAAYHYKILTKGKFPKEAFENITKTFYPIYSPIPGAQILLGEQLNQLENLLRLNVKGFSEYQLDLYRAAVLASGEDMQAPMIEYVLNKLGIKAKRIPQEYFLLKGNPLDSDYNHSSDKKTARFIDSLSEGTIAVLGGFAGKNKKGEFQVFSRGGSDSFQTISMSIYKMAHPEEEVVGYNCTDVDGIKQIDPKFVEEKDRKNIKTVPELSYVQAQNLSLKGGKVLHSKSIDPLIEGDMSLYVMNTFNPDDPKLRTRIYNKEMNGEGKVFAITGLEKKFTSIKLQTGQMEGRAGYLSQFMKALNNVDVETASASGVDISASFHDYNAQIDEIKKKLEKQGKVNVETGNSLIAIVGENIGRSPKILADFFNILDNKDIRVHNIHKSNDVSIWASIDNTKFAEAETALYKGMKDKEYFGNNS